MNTNNTYHWIWGGPKKMERKWIFLIIGLVLVFLYSANTVSSESVQKTIFEIEIEGMECPLDIVIPENNVITFNPVDGTSSYFNFSIDSTYGNITQGYYQGWCVQLGVQMERDINHSGEVYSSYNVEDMSDDFYFRFGQNDTNAKLIWQKINFVLNNIDNTSHEIYSYCNESSYLVGDIQDIIWNITGEKSGDDLSPCSQKIINYLNNNTEDIKAYCPEHVLVLLVDTYQDDSHTGDDDDDDTNTGGGQSSGSTGGGNRPPTADGSKNTPFQANVGEPITFDASKSYDYDGRIIEWNWSFGNEHYLLGEIIEYSYPSAGTYTVNLKVTDNDGSTDTYTTIAEIVQPNRPPDQPILSGEKSCDLQTSYSYTLIATDLDNDTLRFTIDWGDGSDSETTDYYQNNTETSVDHTWTSSGIYTVKVFAEDPSGALSDTTQKTIFANVNVYYIDDEINGYFIDLGKDGTLNSFHDNQTGKTITVEKGDNNWYLLDLNEDGIIDYQYHITNGLQSYVYSVDTAETSWLTGNILYIIVIGLLCIIALILIFFKVEIK